MRRLLGGSRGPAVLFALLVVAAYADPLLTRRNFAGLDLLPYNIPLEKSIHEAYSRGRLPLWQPGISGGRPLLPNPNAGALYPVRPILAALPLPVALRVFPVLHWVLMGLGMIALLQSIGASQNAAWIGAVTYTFSGVAVAENFYPHILPGMTLLPWVVWAVHRPGVSDGVRLLLLSVLFALLLLAGDVFTIGVAVAAGVLWIAVEHPVGMRLREFLLLFLATLLAALIAAPQIVATALWVPETNRAILGMKLRDSFYLTISPFRLLEFLVPYPFGETWSLDWREVWGAPVFRNRPLGLFTTLYAGALGAIALATGGKGRVTGVRFARVLFLAALAISVLPSQMPDRWAGLPSPLPLRNPEKFAVAMVFALGILAALSLDRFRTSARLPRWTLAVGAVLALLAAVAALFPDRAAELAAGMVGAGRQSIPIAARHLPFALAEGGILWATTLVALDLHRTRGKAGLVVSVLLLTAVPIVANRRIARSVPQENVFAPSAFARFLHHADPAGRYRTVSESLYQGASRVESDQPAAPADAAWIYHRHAMWGRGTVLNMDFDAGDLARVESLLRVSFIAAQFRDSQSFYGNLALRWGIRAKDQPPLTGYRRIRANGLQVWDELPEALPDIRLVERWREETGAVGAANLLPRLQLGETVLETGFRRVGRSRPGRVHVLSDDPERLLVDTESPDPTWLFVLRNFWPFRIVLVDGRPADVVPAQLAFSAVQIPAGRHRIDWREELPGGSVSRWGPLVFGLLISGLLIRERRGRRRAS